MRPFLIRLWELRIAIIAYAALLLCGALIGGTLNHLVIPDMRPMNEPMIHRLVMTAFVVFFIASAIPFIPGAEIGFGLLILFGAKAALLVYSGMVLALMLAFMAAKLVPIRIICRGLSSVGMERASLFLENAKGRSKADLLDQLSGQLPKPIRGSFVRFRYAFLALLLNTPGNSLLGGAGGIAFMSGLSGVFGFWGFLCTALVAVAPVPLFFTLMG